jgi:prepilin-type N-terminal cleavage/methylation domain-containing protein
MQFPSANPGEGKTVLWQDLMALDRKHHFRGFTITETLIAVMILGIVAAIGIEAVANTESNVRAERAAREAVMAIRFARSRAMTDGATYKVRFNVGAKTISVIDPANGNAVLAAPLSGSVMQINLSGSSDVANVLMTPVITGASSDPYDVSYSPTGGTTNSGTVTFTYGASTKQLQIPNVGDPILLGDTRKP